MVVRFKFDKYWQTWSRLDKVENGQFHETNLIPVKTPLGIDWSKCGQVRIHGTPYDDGDFTTQIEPIGLRQTLIDNVGIEKTEELIGKSA